MPTALITGSSRGIGEETARIFASAGWDLLMVARDENKLKCLADELKTKGISVKYQSIDLTNPLDVSSGICQLLENADVPSVLVNNAGVAWTGELLSMPLNDWQWLFQINLTSVFQICSVVVPLMRSSGGLVINVSSHAARNAFPQWGAYCISKAALVSFTKCLAEEERANSIRACTLTLGAVDSSLWDTKSVKSDFDRKSMLSVKQVASAILHMAEQPPNQIIEDLTLMPATGAF